MSDERYKVYKENVEGVDVYIYEYKDGVKLKYFSFSQFSPITKAAIGASYSRDKEAIEEKLKKLTDKDFHKRIAEFFAKYGHGSIGDMATLCLSIEGANMIDVARAITFMRFNGQEVSTRYVSLDAGAEKIENIATINNKIKNEKLAIENISTCYKMYQKITDYLIKEYTEKEIKGAKAKAFDIAGSLLPIATRTKAIVYTNVRDLIDHSNRLKAIDVEIGERIQETLFNLFSEIKIEVDDIYLQKAKQQEKDLEDYAFSQNKIGEDIKTKNIDKKIVDNIFNEISSRIVLEGSLHLGSFSRRFLIDFRSLRDVLRHRPFSKSYKLKTPIEFEKWYIEEMGQDAFNLIKGDLEKVIKNANKLLENYSAKEVAEVLPMGVLFDVVMSGSLLHWYYFLRLRAAETVHPTVREVVFKIADEFSRFLAVPIKNILGIKGDLGENYEKRQKDEKII